MICFLLLASVSSEQPRTWPTGVLEDGYEYYGLITDTEERTLTYIRESFDGKTRVIERKLNGHSVRALFELDKVHFVEKFRYSCESQELSDFDNEVNDIAFVWKHYEEHMGPAYIFASIGQMLKSSKMISRVIETKTNKIRNMPAWSWACMITYKLGDLENTINAFVYFTENGYEHSGGNMSVPIRVDLAYTQTHKVTIDLFGFQNEINDAEFISIPDEVPCATSVVQTMPSVVNAKTKNQFHISLEIFDLAYYESEKKAAHAAFYLNVWFDDVAQLAVFEFSTHGEKQLKKIYGSTLLRLVHDRMEDKLFVIDQLSKRCDLMQMQNWLTKFTDAKSHAALEIIVNPALFFGSTETDYSMLKKERIERQFDTNSWILRRSTYPFSVPEETTFNWKWTDKNWIVYD